jgi:hypothetical protein
VRVCWAEEGYAGDEFEGRFERFGYCGEAKRVFLLN